MCNSHGWPYFVHFLSQLANEPKIFKYLEYTHKLAGYINITILEPSGMSYSF